MRTFREGLSSAIPIASGYIPVAITFGIIVQNAGLSVLDATLASLLVFAGAAQFLAISMYASLGAAGALGAGGAVAAAGATGAAGAVAGAGGVGTAGALTTNPAISIVLQIVIAGGLLNLRHILMSAVIGHRLETHDLSPARRTLLAFGITDEVFGVAGNTAGPLSPRFLAGLEIGAWSAWVGGTIIGALIGDILPPTIRTAMGLALYALFTAILAGQLRTAWHRSSHAAIPLLVAALGAATTNTILRQAAGVPPGAAFPIAMVVGALAAMMIPEETAP